MEYFEQLDLMLRTFWYIALPTSLVFLIQSILTFVGVGKNLDLDLDGSSDLDDGLQIISVRSLINFLLGFSWSGVSFFNLIPNSTLLIVACSLVGVSFVWVLFWILKQVNKLSQDNTFQLNQALHKTGEVYLTIPGQLKGKGKVLISVQGSTRELDAITHDEKITTGQSVRVVDIDQDNILIVEKIH